MSELLLHNTGDPDPTKRHVALYWHIANNPNVLTVWSCKQILFRMHRMDGQLYDHPELFNEYCQQISRDVIANIQLLFNTFLNSRERNFYDSSNISFRKHRRSLS